jgi:amidase
VDENMATWPAMKLAAAIRDGELTSSELLECYLDRIDRLGKEVNAVVTLDVDRARATAAAADEARTMGGVGGPLHGLPVTIKDAIETEGIRSTGGAKELADHVPRHDAPAVARLKAAGAIVFGKTNCPTWSADVETHNELFGATSNPWDTSRTTGGSSGGAAAAVAAGFTSFELGTDIGGSVRIPSHCCGVFGLKPTWGVVSQRGYLDHPAGGTIDVDINVFGPIARSIDDIDLLLSVLAGPEPERAVAWHLDLPAAEEHSLADLNVGVWFDEPSAVVDREYRAMLGAVADQLADHGARVVDAHPEVDFGEQYGVFGHLVMEAMTPSMGDGGAGNGSGGGGVGGSHRDWLRADMRRQELRAVWRSWFERHDLLLCPAMGAPAFEHHRQGNIFERMVDVNGEQHSVLELISWLGFIGVLGVPSVCVPIGRTDANLPVGMQIVAPWYHERRAIRAAQLLEHAGVIGGYEPPPGF